MKLLVFIFLAIIVRESVEGQTQDSIVSPEQAIVYMSKHLRDCHREYKTGTILVFSGIGVSALSLAIPQQKTETVTGTQTTNSIGTMVLIVGSVVTLIGGIFHISSHSSIGEAGRLRLTEKGLVIRINK